MSDARTETLWIELPALAAPVRATLAATSRLDLLESIALRLIALEPRTPDRLARSLAIPVELVRSALDQLETRGLAMATEGKAAGPWGAVPRDEPSAPGAFVLGWVFVAPHEPRLLPAVLLAQRCRSSPPRGAIPAPHTVRWSSFPRPEDADRWLGQINASGLDVRDDAPQSPDGDAFDRARETPELATAVYDVMGHEPGRGRESLAPVRYERSYCWARVELIPCLAGAPEVVFHDPEPCPGEEVTPVSATLGAWIATELPEVARAIEERRTAFTIQNSLVLRRAGIDTMAAFEEAIRQHQTEAAARTRCPNLADGLADGELARQLREAHGWLICWQREPTFKATAIDAYGHAIERLCTVLRMRAVPPLKGWIARSNLRPTSIAEAQNQLTELGFADRLETSRSHVVRALENPKKLRDHVAKHENAGAGESLTLWLLPLVLLDLPSARAYAAQLDQALRKHPLLFDDLNKLLQVRNDAFHGRPSRLQPDQADELLAAVLAALS